MPKVYDALRDGYLLRSLTDAKQSLARGGSLRERCMAISNQEHPFFRPLWRRVAIVAVTAIWSGVEWYHGEQVWGMLTLAICVYSIWTFLITYPKQVDGAE